MDTLEKEIGQQLFTRTKRSVSLTGEGILFLPYAKRILEMADTSVQKVNSLNKYRQNLRIGTTNSIYECHLIPQIKYYRQMNPDHAVKITIGHSADLILGIQDRLYDIIYTYIPFKKQAIPAKPSQSITCCL